MRESEGPRWLTGGATTIAIVYAQAIAQVSRLHNSVKLDPALAPLKDGSKSSANARTPRKSGLVRKLCRLFPWTV